MPTRLVTSASMDAFVSLPALVILDSSPFCAIAPASAEAAKKTDSVDITAISHRAQASNPRQSGWISSCSFEGALSVSPLIRVYSVPRA